MNGTGLVLRFDDREECKDAPWRLRFRGEDIDLAPFSNLERAQRVLIRVLPHVSALLDELSRKQADQRSAIWADFAVGAR